MDEKKCSRCGLIKPIAEFSYDRSSKDGYGYWCKSCAKEKYREKHPKPHRAFRGPLYPATDGMKVCLKCNENKPVSEYSKRSSAKDGLNPICKSCYNKNQREKRDKEYAKQYYREHDYEMRERSKKYLKCVSKPSCTRVGSKGAVFVLFTCEVCGNEFRRSKRSVNHNYERRGTLPRFCSRECRDEANLKHYQTPYARKMKKIIIHERTHLVPDTNRINKLFEKSASDTKHKHTNFDKKMDALKKIVG